MLCEIGGTVGDIEGLPFFEAIRQFGNELPRGHAFYIHLTLLPFIPSAGELKTKPTQHSVKELRSIGIQPDILLCRSDRPIPESERKKLALFCNVRESAVIEARDVHNIYAVPEAYHAGGLDDEVLAAFGIEIRRRPICRLAGHQRAHPHPEGEVTIAVVGKYTGMKDAYKSLIEALIHGGVANKVKVNLDWIESEVFENEDPAPFLEHVHGILVPGRLWPARRGGQDPRGAVRPRAPGPVFRHLLWHANGRDRSGAKSVPHRAAAFNRIRAHQRAGGRPDDRMDEGNELEKRASTGDLGGTMRLGAYEAMLTRGSRIAEIYGATISERHRHRYEVNIGYKDLLGQRHAVVRSVARRNPAGDHRATTIPGSSACNSIPN